MPRTGTTIQSAYLDFHNEMNTHHNVFRLALAEAHSEPSDFQTMKLRFAEWYAIVGLLDAWGRLWKRAIFASAEGYGPTLKGHHVIRTSQLSSGLDVEQVLKINWKKRFRNYPLNGPSWHIPTAAADAASLLGIANMATVSGALLATTYAPEELRACRNYLAHRHSGTEHHAGIRNLRSRLGLSSSSPHTELLAMELVPGNRTLYEDWCIELERIAKSALA